MMNGDARASGAGGYASVNGFEMYYEIHGAGQPLVLLHSAFSAIGTSFGKVLPSLAKTGRSLREVTDTVALVASDDSIRYRDELHHVKGE